MWRLFQKSIALIFSNLSKVVLQGLYFVLAARLLGPTDFGVFNGIVSLCGVLLPFSGLGMGSIITRAEAYDTRAFKYYWTLALKILSLSSAILVLVVITLRIFGVFSVGAVIVVLFISISEIACVPMADLTAQSLVALEYRKLCALVQLVLPFMRCVAVFILLLTPARSLSLWAGLYCVSGVIASVFCIYLVWRIARMFSGNQGNRHRLFSIKDGLLFSISLSAQNVYNNIDKAILAESVSPVVTGIYSVAYKMIDVAYVPVRALLLVSYRSFFEAGQHGLGATVRLTRRLMWLPLCYSVVFALLAYFFSFYMGDIFGRSYEVASQCLRYLCWLPILKTFHYYAADAFTGANKQGIRSGIQCAMAVFNFSIGVLVIPVYGWKGASILSLITDGLLAATLWISLFYFLHRQTVASAKYENVEENKWQNSHEF